MKHIYKKVIATLITIIILTGGMSLFNASEQVYAASAFENSIVGFPESYKGYLRELNKKYTNWKFQPLDTGLDWNTVVSAQTDPVVSGKGNLSLVAKSASDLLKRNETSDFNIKTGQYIYKDSTSWVSANSNTVAYFLDPRNFLNEVNVFQFENNAFDKNVHTLSGVKKILEGTFMDSAKGTISYLDTNGKTVKTSTTYAEEIFNAAKKTGASPYALASKIRQEVGGYVDPSGSVSGKYTSKDGKTVFTGYYNFYNIGANDGADPISNGLNYAKQSDSSLLRPWTTPMKSIEGGAIFFANNYIKTYQNTGYLVKFNVDKRSSHSLYTHQFMTNISGAAQETSTTYNAYKNIGTLSQVKVFLIPVYKNMPTLTNNITINDAKNKVGTVDGALNVRSGPGMAYGSMASLGNKEKVTILEGVRANTGYSYDNLKYPYWYKVKFSRNGKDTTGFVFSEYLQVETKKTVATGQVYQIPATRTKASDKVYYLSDNPAVATVDASGKVTSKKQGQVTIYAFLGSGKMDSIKISVENFIINTTSKSLYVGNTLTLKATVATADKTLKWSSNNSAAATVDSKGKVIAKQPGTATITVKNSSGAIKQCVITVLPMKTTLSVSSFDYNVVNLKWSKAKDADGYQVYRLDPGQKSYKIIATISKNTTVSYKDSKVVNGSAYKYGVRSYKKVGSKTYYSGYTYVDAVAKPKAIQLNPITAKSKRAALVKWNKANGISAYVVYRRTGKSGKYVKIKILKGDSTFQLTDTSLKKGQTYYYRVRAYKTTNKKNIYGAYSKALPITIK